MKIVKIIATIVVIVLCVLIVRTVKQKSHQARLKPAPVQSVARFKGAVDAPIQIKEFTDFQCPACAKAVPVVEDLLKKYGARIGLEHKHFPLPMHKNSIKASIFAECAAAQGKFWPYHDVLFKSQTSWANLDEPSSYFEDLGLQLGLDGGKLKACVASEDVVNRINSDKIDGEIVGITGTPTFVIDGKLFVGADNLKGELEARLGK